MKLYNTLTKKLEEFTPLSGSNVGMYVCGVTVYDVCHLGHARAYVAFDAIRRYLEYKGFRVNYVQNFTDIDDKIIERAGKIAKERGGSDIKGIVREITGKYTDEYFRYMDALSVKRASVYPAATGHISEMIALIGSLVEKGYGYEAGGDVFFSIEKFSPYGRLSGRAPDEMRAGARVEIDKNKRHPLDFALWKSAKDGHPSWESPWGAGRPGWHIECSAMGLKYLGQSFDIHGGGQDLIFPHHENEIAQSEAHTGKPFVRYWLHNGFVTINREKMSKSLGNFFSLPDIFKKYKPEVVRLFLLSTHYRSPIDFSEDALTEAEKRLNRIRECDHKLLRLPADVFKMPVKERRPTEHRRSFEDYMDDDFNTAGAISVVFQIVRELNTALRGKIEPQELAGQAQEFSEFRRVLGISSLFRESSPIVVKADTAEVDVDEVERLLDGGVEHLDDEQINKLVLWREKARHAKDWQTADRIRKKLSAHIKLQDTPEGTLWEREE